MIMDKDTELYFEIMHNEFAPVAGLPDLTDTLGHPTGCFFLSAYHLQAL